jgi:hypothetical protein
MRLSVIAGLDPAIHHLGKKTLAMKMDHPNSGSPEFGNFGSQVG